MHMLGFGKQIEKLLDQNEAESMELLNIFSISLPYILQQNRNTNQTCGVCLFFFVRAFPVFQNGVKSCFSCFPKRSLMLMGAGDFQISNFKKSDFQISNVRSFKFSFPNVISQISFSKFKISHFQLTIVQI